MLTINREAAIFSRPVYTRRTRERRLIHRPFGGSADGPQRAGPVMQLLVAKEGGLEDILSTTSWATTDVISDVIDDVIGRASSGSDFR